MNRTNGHEGSHVMSVLNGGGRIDEVNRGCCWYIRKTPDPVRHVSYFAMLNTEEERQACEDWANLMKSIGLPGTITLGTEGTTALSNFVSSNGFSRSIATSDGGYGVLEFGEADTTQNWFGRVGENYAKLMAHTFFRYLWSRGKKLTRLYSKLRRSINVETCSNWNILRLALLLNPSSEYPSYGPINDHPMTWVTEEEFRTRLKTNISSIQGTFNQGGSTPGFISNSSFTFAHDTAIHSLKETLRTTRANATVDPLLISAACSEFGRFSDAIQNIDNSIEDWDEMENFDFDIKVFSNCMVGAFIDMDSFEDIYIVMSKF